MNVKEKLLLGIAAGLVACNYFALQGANDVLNKLNYWQRIPAYLASVTPEDTAEVKIKEGIESGKRVTVPIATITQYRNLTDVVLLRDPNAPSAVALLDYWGLWEPILGRTLIIIALTVLGYRLWRSNVGTDSTWSDGKWLATPAGKSKILGSPTQIREASEARAAVVLWAVVMGIVAALAIPGVILHGSIFATIIAIVAVGFFLIAAWTWIETYTRRFLITDDGLIDKTLLGTKRAAWSAIKNIQLVNINREAQARYDRTAGQNKGKRPQTINVYRLTDDTDKEIFQLSEQMNPPPAFDAMREKILQMNHSAKAPEMEADEEVDDPDAVAMQHEQMAEFRRAQLRQLRLWAAGFIAASMIFLLPAAYMSYRTLWFQFAAERVEADVVAVSAEEAASLTIAYRIKDGSVLRLESGGSPIYAKFRVGDKLAVFYDPQMPQDARADLFLENWLGILIVGVLGAGLALLAWLVYRHQAKSLQRMV